ncbi:replication protein [Legionella gresilensis]|uniref:replication protein n=1 Tax=Legionella gresilensis TaxID=91823 RepID=UPI001040E801|nr:replication protein [Legionella gresilensis]
MSVLRIHKKQQNFVILDKTCLQDSHLSWGAKGLHAYLMSMPDDWRVKVADLKNRATNGRDAVRSLLDELERAGYISKSTCRSTSGRFEGLEYIVYEMPQLDREVETPKTENTSSVAPRPNKPAPENPTSDNPTLLSNKNTNNLLTKKAASNKPLSNTQLNHKKTAAAFSDKNKPIKEKEKEATTCGKQTINFLPASDSVIGSELSVNQQKRIEAMVRALNVSGAEKLIDEISYCLLNPKHFTACRQDFGRKLNAIRAVILRGEWQRPAEMVIKAEEATHSTLNHLKKELDEVRAEAIHFQRLLTDANVHHKTREQFELIVKKAQLKMNALQSEMSHYSKNNDVLVSAIKL